MKITVIGATGATGKKVVERALELGHEVVAVARRPEIIIPTTRLSVQQGDVFDIASLVKALANTDTVISCIGPTKNFSPGTVMSKGIPNILIACQRTGVKRFVMQSGITLSDGRELSALNRCGPYAF